MGYYLFCIKNTKRRIMKERTDRYPSPQNDRRGCLCKDGKTYSRKCCDGSFQAQGIGNITGTE